MDVEPDDKYIVDKHELEQKFWASDEDEDWDDFWSSDDLVFDDNDEEKDEDVFIPAE